MGFTREIPLMGPRVDYHPTRLRGSFPEDLFSDSSRLVGMVSILPYQYAMTPGPQIS
jgi:hypothetical protein